MQTAEAIRRRRTVRRFRQEPVSRRILEDLVDAARLAPSASNLQPLKYIVVDDPGQVSAVFDQVKWAAYLAPEGTPAEGERPVVFIAVLVDTEIRRNGYELDIGAACGQLLLAAVDAGLGACWMGAINRTEIIRILEIPEQYLLNTVVALGYPAEEPVAEDETGSIRYYKDAEGVLHVPKRKKKDILVGFNRAE